MTSASGVHLRAPPHRLQHAFKELFTKDAILFLTDLVEEFDTRVEDLFVARLERKLAIKNGWTPNFVTSPERSDKTWKISPLPKRLHNRKLDLGDVSPANTNLFIDSLNADVQGVQVDFDDGHCPTWRNTIKGLHNVFLATRGALVGAPVEVDKAPVMMLRPRAWNMTEHNCFINGKEVPGPLFDFAFLMFHCGRILHEKGSGPFFYLSKIEYYNETTLWNEIFVWAQNRLSIPTGTIKACVLIENICASFCLEEILYSLLNHSLGLNCGIWDYAASIICKFGTASTFVIPDRSKYVNMKANFLKSYLQLVVQTSHNRGAPATGGMAAQILPSNKNNRRSHDVIKTVAASKRTEIHQGVDGFMVYDFRLVPFINDLWAELCESTPNQIDKTLPSLEFTPSDLLTITAGGVTLAGLKNNIIVAMLFIYHWLEGQGHFILNGAVEDSATAEISRSQLWQWIRHLTFLEDQPAVRVDLQFVEYLANDIHQTYSKGFCKNDHDRKRLTAAKYMLMELVTARDFPEFITTYLNDNHKFRSLHAKSDDLMCKL